MLKIAKKFEFLVNIRPQGMNPLKRFLQNLAWGRESQVRTLMPNFTVVAFKMCACSPLQIAKIG